MTTIYVKFPLDFSRFPCLKSFLLITGDWYPMTHFVTPLIPTISFEPVEKPMLCIYC